MKKVIISRVLMSLIGAAMLDQIMVHTVDHEVDKKLKEKGVV